MSLDFSQEKVEELQGRFVFCFLVAGVFFFVVLLRLFYLQIVKGEQFYLFSVEHTIKEVSLPASRGVIFDRNGVPIAENRPSFDITLVPQHVKDIEKVKKSLAALAGISPDFIDSKWKQVRNAPIFFPVVIAKDIPYDQAAKIRVHAVIPSDEDDLDNNQPRRGVEGEAPSALPMEGATRAPMMDLRGIEIRARPLRYYPQGSIASAALGYVAEVSERDLARVQKEEPGKYGPGDLVGAVGIERFWEKDLRGSDGYTQKVVDAVGREIANEEVAEFLGRQESMPGKNLVLTLDARLQKFAEEKFHGKTGALAAMDPRTGEILALVSLPSYDPSTLVANISPTYWSSLVQSPNKYFLNRVIQGTYPPGSTYKVVTAIAALEEGLLRPGERINCPGGLQYGGRFFKCWNKSGHGLVSVHEAIASSCDTFFYILGLRLGVDRMAKYARMFGLGHKTGIDLEGEKAGLIPTAQWKKKILNQEWQPGENLSIAVGQGYDTVTPLQNALMVAQVATGKKIRPHLFKARQDEEGYEVIPVSAETFKIIRSGMRDAVESPIGTAHRIKSQYVKMAGKTGTAQVISEEAKGRAAGKMNTGDHAWFVVYAPFEDPKIAVSVIVEHGGYGAAAAAPIAKDVIEKYLELEGMIAP